MHSSAWCAMCVVVSVYDSKHKQVLRRIFWTYGKDAQQEGTVDSGPLVGKLLHGVHDRSNSKIEEVLSKLYMESGVSKKVWNVSVMKRIKEVMSLVGAPSRSRLVGNGALDAAKLLSRLPWIKLRYTNHIDKKYPDNTSVGVNANPHELIKAWLLQYRRELDGLYFNLDTQGKGNIIDLCEGARMRFVIIIDANVVGENSKLGNDKGVFHTTAVVIKVLFWKGQDRVHDLILGVLYCGNDHYPEFKDHALAWCNEVNAMTSIKFCATVDENVQTSFELPIECIATLPDGAGLRELLGAFSIGVHTIFDSPFHSLPSLLRFSSKYADQYGRPWYHSPTTGGKDFRRMFSDYVHKTNVKTCGLRFNYKRPSLISHTLVEVLNGLFHMGTGLAKWFAARICEAVCDGGVASVSTFISHCRSCLGFYFK